MFFLLKLLLTSTNSKFNRFENLLFLVVYNCDLKKPTRATKLAPMVFLGRVSAKFFVTLRAGPGFEPGTLRGSQSVSSNAAHWSTSSLDFLYLLRLFVLISTFWHWYILLDHSWRTLCGCKNPWTIQKDKDTIYSQDRGKPNIMMQRRHMT